jgi:hypothetical protein
MGKRSDFERIPRDLYRTPLKAVLPLIPYLHRDGARTFAEPCAGQNDLVRYLQFFGLHCLYRGDIATGQDVLKLTAADYNGADVGITNPPYKRPEDPDRTTRLLRDLIRHFLDLGVPTWLLIYSDWMINQNAAPFLPRCSDVVAIGRVQWTEGSESSGKDNAAWFRFEAHHRGNTTFHNDRGQCATFGEPELRVAAE